MLLRTTKGTTKVKSHPFTILVKVCTHLFVGFFLSARKPLF